jgi:hypothetical protein
MERAAGTGAAVGQEAQVRSTVPLEARRSGTPAAAVVRGDDSTRLAAVAGPDPDELTVRIFRALYPQFDLRMVDGTLVVVPKGTAWFASPSLGEIARQISDHEQQLAREAQ